MPRATMAFVNADEIARQMAIGTPSASALDVAAGRAMLTAIDRLVGQRSDFMLETTPATRTYARKIPQWRQSGYSIALIYLRLPSAETSIERVRKRVLAGGHSLPESVIRRRFDKSARYLEAVYKPLVDEWYVYDSLEGAFALAEAWDD